MENGWPFLKYIPGNNLTKTQNYAYDYSLFLSTFYTSSTKHTPILSVEVQYNMKGSFSIGHAYKSNKAGRGLATKAQLMPYKKCSSKNGLAAAHYNSYNHLFLLFSQKIMKF